MPIAIRDDAVYVILKKINDANQGQPAEDISFSKTDFVGMDMDKSDLLGHLDYLNQKQYIEAEFSGNAYGNQEDVPSVVNPDEVNLRVANTYGAEDGPLPHLVAFERAELTEKGREMLADMNANPPKNMDSGPKVPLPNQHMSFIEKVMTKGALTDPYDARDIIEVVFRVMRDVMTTAEADRIEAELGKEDVVDDAKDKSLHVEVADLWHDTNPIVGFLSRLRPPLKGQAPFGIDSDLFLSRVDNEGAVPPTTNSAIVTRAVFSATKDELSKERIEEIANWLPEGKVKALWQEA
ncbi:DUF2267 domain-containing protein [Oscillatoria sp. CS-180]|uniref:DUF2267 domain-containing protein n=1 Tax=Oscillatoria sp. CS-180 TaxID=3021720 RepID=UPI002330628F|nr:DUF2267 domain-containing protein [Oscillatoria sp. CS-180]MDB9526027.1 DUF2267 domain-containing protein [Oscillatoria sp. CS-180]